MSEMRLMIDWDLTAAECRALLALHAVAIINRAMGVDVHLQNPDLVGA